MMSATQEDVLCVIPARGGSKGLPGKNLMELEGESLIARAVRHARESGVCDVVVVTTDSEEIAARAREVGALVPFLRQPELSGDLATTEATLLDALLRTELALSRTFEICVFISPTDIFREPNWISACVHSLRNDESLESAFVGLGTHKNYWEQQEDGSWIRLRDWMKIYASRQVRRKVVREDTGLASASRSRIWREGRRIGDRVMVIVHDDDFTSIDIHKKEDLDLARAATKIRADSHV
jgi:CMP-N-acetylneuraminic acid synthetase